MDHLRTYEGGGGSLRDFFWDFENAPKLTVKVKMRPPDLLHEKLNKREKTNYETTFWPKAGISKKCPPPPQLTMTPPPS